MTIILMLVVMAVVFSLMQYWFSRNWNKHLDVSMKFAAPHAVAGEDTSLLEVVSNRKLLPVPYLVVKFEMDGSLDMGNDEGNAVTTDLSYRNDVFSLLHYQRMTKRIPLHLSKRGVFSISQIQLVASGLLMRNSSIEQRKVQAQLVVYPRSADTGRLEIAFHRVMGTLEKTSFMMTDPFSFRGIRDYEIYDSMKDINWKATARTGSMMVNQYNETLSQDICILLNFDRVGMHRYEKLEEESISIAAGLAQMLIGQGVAVSMACNGSIRGSAAPVWIAAGNDASHLRTINTMLAEVSAEVEPAPFQQILANLEGQRDAYSSQIVYVMISANVRDDLQREYRHYCGGTDRSMWIAPYHADSRQMLDRTLLPVTGWEVER